MGYVPDLAALQTLGLMDTKVTDAGLVHLTGLTNLQTLNFSFTKVTDAGIADLKKAFPNCAIRK